MAGTALLLGRSKAAIGALPERRLTGNELN